MSAKRHFLLDSIVFQGLNWLIKPVWIFLIDREVQNYLGEEVYGQYSIHLNFTFLFVILLDIGMHNFQTKEVASNKRFILTGTPSLVWIKILFSVVYIFLVWSIGISNQLLSFSLLALGLNQILNSWILFFRTILAGLHLFRLEAFVSVFDRFLAIIGIGIFIFRENLKIYFGINEFILFQTVALVLGLLFVMLVCVKRVGLKGISLPKTPRITKLFKASLPFAVLALVMNFYTRLDVFFIHKLADSPNQMAGIYAHGYRFLEAASMFVMLFTGMLFPIFSKQLSAKENFEPMLRLVLKLVWIPGIFLLVISLFKGEEIMDLMYHSKSEYSASVFVWLMASYIPMSGSLVLGALITAGGHIKQLIVSSLVALLILVICSFIFIPEQGALGAAKSVFVTQISVFILFVILMVNYMKKPDFTSILVVGKFILIGLILVVTAWQFTAHFEVGIVWFGLALAGLLVVLILLFNLINPKQIRELRKL